MRSLKSITFLFICILTACSDSGEVLSPTHSLLLGKWWWLRTYGGRWQVLDLTRDSTATTITMEFYADTYQVYDDNALRARYSYSVKRDDLFNSPNSLLTMKTLWHKYYPANDAPETPQLIRFQTADTLVLEDACFDDCYTRIWTRVK